MISIYIHWPFCLSKCPYCDFNSHVSKNIDNDLWLKNYLHELNIFLPVLKGKTVKTIFFGGGTPSLMPTAIVEEIINFIKKNAQCDEDLEITLEMNPTSIEINKLYGFSQAGVNRVSIGIQSLNNHSLKFLGRNHSAEEALKCLELANRYFNNVSFDIIYGLPHQSIDDWKQECELAMKYVTNHVSLYQLMIEPDTKFYSLYKAGKLKPHNDEVLYAMYDYTNEQLNQHGLQRYEISNYAKNGYESKHNLVYWNYDEYLGIGPGAHSRLLYSDFISSLYIKNKMMAIKNMEMQCSDVRKEIVNDINVRKQDGNNINPGMYNVYAMSQVSNPSLWLQGYNRTNIEFINRIEVAKEMIMMSLRTVYGMSMAKFYRYTGMCFKNYFGNLLQSFHDSNLLVFDKDYVILTSQG
ncbi:MAG: radical SAM family heme chaperone HemW, partial [Pseudomonadota bacterium]